MKNVARSSSFVVCIGIWIAATMGCATSVEEDRADGSASIEVARVTGEAVDELEPDGGVAVDPDDGCDALNELDPSFLEPDTFRHARALDASQEIDSTVEAGSGTCAAKCRDMFPDWDGRSTLYYGVCVAVCMGDRYWTEMCKSINKSCKTRSIAAALKRICAVTNW